MWKGSTLKENGLKKKLVKLFQRIIQNPPKKTPKKEKKTSQTYFYHIITYNSGILRNSYFQKRDLV